MQETIVELDVQIEPLEALEAPSAVSSLAWTGILPAFPWAYNVPISA